MGKPPFDLCYSKGVFVGTKSGCTGLDLGRTGTGGDAAREGGVGATVGLAEINRKDLVPEFIGD